MKMTAVVAFILLVVAFLLPIFVGGQPYIMHLLIIIFVFASFAQTWNLLAGYAGQISLGQNVFFGVGAYTSALLVYYYPIFKANPWQTLIIGGIFSMLVSLPFGILCFKLRGPYLALSTLAASEVVRLIILNTEFTLAGLGVVIPVPPNIQLGGFIIDFRSKIPYYYIALSLMLLVFYTTYVIVKSRYGIQLLAIKENQDAASMLGVNSLRMKLLALVISSFICGLTGALYAQYITYVDASSDPGGVLSLSTGLDVIVINVLGGVGTVLGPLIGAFVKIGASELLRLNFGWTGGMDLLIFGVLLIICVVFFRRGLWGSITQLKR